MQTAWRPALLDFAVILLCTVSACTNRTSNIVDSQLNQTSSSVIWLD